VRVDSCHIDRLGAPLAVGLYPISGLKIVGQAHNACWLHHVMGILFLFKPLCILCSGSKANQLSYYASWRTHMTSLLATNQRSSQAMDIVPVAETLVSATTEQVSKA
jgi:hypothetical protein